MVPKASWSAPMADAFVCLDESGDLGWSFDQPYRYGGSSRHLTIASFIAPMDKRHLPKRLIRRLCKANGWASDIEVKWSDMSDAQRLSFAQRVDALLAEEPSIELHAIVVKKENVRDHIRSDANKLYNYMIKCSLIEHFSKFDAVHFCPDARAVKVSSGNSLHDYLLTTLWFETAARTTLSTRPLSSDKSKAVQFADMLSGSVQSHFEDGRSDPFNRLRRHLTLKRLFF